MPPMSVMFTYISRLIKILHLKAVYIFFYNFLSKTANFILTARKVWVILGQEFPKLNEFHKITFGELRMKII